VHRAIPLVQVTACVGRHRLGEMEKALASAYGRVLVHVNNVLLQSAEVNF
jgi:hypothetical protein